MPGYKDVYNRIFGHFQYEIKEISDILWPAGDCIILLVWNHSSSNHTETLYVIWMCISRWLVSHKLHWQECVSTFCFLLWHLDRVNQLNCMRKAIFTWNRLQFQDRMIEGKLIIIKMFLCYSFIRIVLNVNCVLLLN